MTKIDFIVLCCLIACIPFAASQFETGSQKVAGQWFWNSTTAASESQTADDLSSATNSTSTTPSTLGATSSNNSTEDAQISPVLLNDDFLPANITDGRSSSSSLLAELFSDDFVPANVTRGRSAKVLDLDLIGNVREGRILNEDPGNRRLSLQGFIPIVAFSGKEDDKESLSKSPKRIQDNDDLYYNNGPYAPIPLDEEEQTKAENFYSPVTTTEKNHRQSYQKAIDHNSKHDNGYGARIQQQDQNKHHNYYIPPPTQNSASNNQKIKEKFAPNKEVVRYVTAEDYHKRPTYQEPAPQQDAFISQQNAAVNSYLKNLQEQYLGNQNQQQGSYPQQDQYKPQQDQYKPQQDQYKPQQDQYKPQQDQYLNKATYSNPQEKYHGQDSVNSYLKPQQDQYKPSYHTKHDQQDAVKAESQAGGHFIVSSKPSKNNDEEAQYAPAPGPYPAEPIRERYPSQEPTAKQVRPGSKQFDQEGLYELSNGNYILSDGGQPGGYEEATEDKCICVPFYLCRNGYLTNYGRSLEKDDDIDERSARKIAKRDIGNQTESRDAKTESETLAPYTEDIMARMIGLNNVGDSCGLLRRCCRVPRRVGGISGPPGGLLPFSPDNYPLPPSLGGQHTQLPPGFTLQGNGEDPQAFIVNQQDQYQPSSGHPAYHQPGGQQIILVPQEVPHQPPHRRPRPIMPQPKPISPPQQHRPNPNRSVRPVYPQRQRPHHIQPQEPVYQPQSSYPQPVYPPPGLRPPKQHQPEYVPAASGGGQCGARNGFGIHGRVNNLQYTDDASEFGEYPWQAAILLKVGPGNNLFVCGGTLISSQWVATAAHCLKKHHADELKVRLGDWDVHRDDEFYPYVEKFVVEVVAHPDFYPGNLHNDLALLRLEAPIDPTLPHISPACLPEQNERFDKERCWVTGWGKNAFGEQGEYQSVLKEVDIPMLGHRDCEHRLKQTRLGRSYSLHPGFLCAGGEPGKDACTGDGGSPLVCEHGGTWKVAGLVSWGIGCGQPGVPGIYVNMAKYRGWIDTVLHGNRRG